MPKVALEVGVVNSAFASIVERARRTVPEPPGALPIEERRAIFRAEALSMRGEMAVMERVVDVELALATRVLSARYFVPTSRAPHVVVLYLHGGSFVAGDLDTHEWLCRRLAHDTGLAFLALEYRLAPEHPFPAAIEDTVDCARYLALGRGEFTSVTHVVLMGDSAGANLAAVAAAQLRDDVRPAAQVLIYPTLGPDVVTDSAHRFARGYLLELDHLQYDYGQYLAGTLDHTDPRVSPLLNDDLAGVAPAIVVVAGCDPLRDEGVAYAGLLEHFQVPVELLEATGMVHGFLEYGGVVPEALAIVDDLARHLTRFVSGVPS